MSLHFVRNDITRMPVDVIVNAANTALHMGGGVCGAIFAAAGAQHMQAACDTLGPISTGQAVITPGFDLPARYVIHTAGPIHARHSPRQSEQLLRQAYRNSLLLAQQNGCQSIAFPLISSGIHGYPKDQALQVACSEIRAFLHLQNDEPDVYLVIFDQHAFALGKELLGTIASHIDDLYVEQNKRHFGRHSLQQETSVHTSNIAITDLTVSEQPENFKLDEPFEVHLLRLIRASGKSEVEIYKKANLNRKLFSKIRTGNGYVPGKRTILALAIALELDLQQTGWLLKQAGYALTRNQKLDVIIEYFIRQRLYDIFSINAVLFQYELPLLGS